MPWREASVMRLRREFIDFVNNEGNISRLSESFGISRQTGYKWIHRYWAEGDAGLQDRSRRPIESPGKVSEEVENEVITIRVEHPKWGGRKIRRRLQTLGIRVVPAASTITAILKRRGLIEQSELRHCPFIRFEREHPNDLWQMDFKGHVSCPEGRCHPLTVLDDHSRYSVVLKACLNELTETVQNCLREAFRRYGLPNQIITDNGPPWSWPGGSSFTELSVWLMRLNILVAHSRPAHPETLGKEERFHRTLKAELLGDSIAWYNSEAQMRFDKWRFEYNHHRPHEALNMQVPASRYQVSRRPFPESLPAIEYAAQDIVRKVQNKGIVHFQGRQFRIPSAFTGLPVALRPRAQCDGIYDVYFLRQLVTSVNLRDDHD